VTKSMRSILPYLIRNLSNNIRADSHYNGRLKYKEKTKSIFQAMLKHKRSKSESSAPRSQELLCPPKNLQVMNGV
jgi:hypothetical protein